MAGSKGVPTGVRTGRHRLGGGEETGGGDKDKIGSGFGGGRGAEWGLGRRGGISGSERVKWIGMERGRQEINLDRGRAGSTSGEGQRSSKNLNLKRDRV